MSSSTLVACHDAGATNILVSWMNRHPKKTFDIFADGPGRRILERDASRRVEGTLAELLEDDSNWVNKDALYTGASWGTDKERRLWLKAKKNRIPANAIFDSFGDFTNGLLLEGRRVEPSRAICFTEGAKKHLLDLGLAPNQIELWQDPYLEDVSARVQSLEKGPRRSHNLLLYILENISDSEASFKAKDSRYRGYSEFEALDYFWSHVKGQTFGPVEELVLRPHPSDPKEKYRDWVQQKGSSSKIRIEEDAELEELLAQASVVVGCESRALAVAAHCGKKVYSCIPPKANFGCRLEEREIIQVGYTDRG